MKQPFRIFRHLTWTISAMVLMCAGGVNQACAEDLARFAPQNTMFFLARSGNAQIDKTALDTSWGKLLAEPEMVRFRASLCKAVEQSILTMGKPDEDELKARELIYELLSDMGEFPTALIVQNIAISPAGPVVEAALICEMGDRAESLLSKIGDALKIDTTGENRVKLGQHEFVHVDGPPNGIYFGKVDQFFVASMGRQSAQAVADLIVGEEKKSLAAHEGVVSARKHFEGNEESRVISGFLNVAGIRSIVNAFVPMLAMSDPDLPNVVQSLQSVLGLDGLDSIVWESHYRDGGCVGAWFLHMPQGAAGLLGSPGKPLSDDDLKWIPRDASWAVASKFDMAGTYRKVRESLKKWKSMSKNVDDAIKQVEKFIGFKIDEDFLSHFGDSFVLYDSFDSGGFLFSGTVVVMSVKDGGQLRERLGQLISLIEVPKPSGSEIFGKISFKVGRIEHRGHLIEFFNGKGLPMVVTPAWTVCEDRFIVGAYPQMVIATIDRLADEKLSETSILAHPDVIQARKVVGNGDAGFSFVDSRAGLRMTYSLLLPLASAVASMAQGQGIELDPSSIPSLATLTRHMFADVRCSRNVEDGMVSLSYGSWPLPGSPGLSANVATVATGISILLPSLSRARELSKRTVCAANMRGIGQAMYIHAMDHDEKFPKRLAELIKDNNVTPRQFVCPSTVAIPHEDPTEKQLTECYVYIPGSTTSSDPRNVILYERFDNHQREGVNVLFQDGHVSFTKDIEHVKQLIKETKDRLGIKKKKASGKKKI